jgi:hypothetical protein
LPEEQAGRRPAPPAVLPPRQRRHGRDLAALAGAGCVALTDGVMHVVLADAPFIEATWNPRSLGGKGGRRFRIAEGGICCWIEVWTPTAAAGLASETSCIGYRRAR